MQLNIFSPILNRLFFYLGLQDSFYNFIDFIKTVNLLHLQKKVNEIMMGKLLFISTSQMMLTAIRKKTTITMLTGIFDGLQMTTNDGSQYPVPSNYASKSMLVPGDILKLSIEEDGSLVYKLIKSASRKHIRGIIHKKDNQFLALGSNNQNYKLNTASVTFHKAQCGDEVCLIINEGSEFRYAALETVLKNH